MPDRTDTQYLEEIANTLKSIKLTLEDFKNSFEAQHDLLMNKLSVIESISGDSRDSLFSIETKE